MRRTFLLESVAALRASYEHRIKSKKELHHHARHLDALGEQQAAEQVYVKILQADSRNAEASLELGLIDYRAGRFNSALERILLALEAEPSDARIHHAFGLVLKDVSQPEEALLHYQRAIGVTDIRMGLDALQEACRRAAMGADHDYLAHLRLGNVLMAQDTPHEAITAYAEGFRIHKTSAVARNLAFVCDTLGDQCGRSLYLGYACFLDERPDEAVKLLEAMPSKPYADLYFCRVLLSCYLELKHYPKAIDVYQQAVLYHPDASALALHIGSKLHAAARAADVIQLAGEALQKWPGNLGLKHLYHLVLPAIYESEEEIDFYRQRFSDGVDAFATEALPETVTNFKEAREAIGRVSNFYLAYQNRNDIELQKRYGALVQRILGSQLPEWTKPLVGAKAKTSRIRVGYVSAFLYSHSVGNMHLGWLRHRDSARFEIFCYHIGGKQDFVTSQYRAASDHFRHMPAGLESICQQIFADELQILVFLDIGMDTLTAQLAALRLAPVQCCSWGHPVTTGLKTMDYFISGSAMEPQDCDTHYSEKLIQLPGFGLAYETIDAPTEPKTREAFGIPAESIVYVCSQSLFKYLPQHDYIFTEIAMSVPQAIFVFISSSDGSWDEKFQRRLRREFEKRGLNYESHCMMLPRLDWLDYLSLNVRSDIYLDSLGWSGGNTSLEAIACGLPIVTLPGKFMRGRHTYAFLQLMGITETIAQTEKDYISIAVRLGDDAEFRRTVSRRVISRRDCLYNDQACVRALEDFYCEAVKSAVSYEENASLSQPKTY